MVGKWDGLMWANPFTISDSAHLEEQCSGSVGCTTSSEQSDLAPTVLRLILISYTCDTCISIYLYLYICVPLYIYIDIYTYIYIHINILAVLVFFFLPGN